MTEEYNERELEDALVANVTKFLVELGTGFAYMGRQYKIRNAGQVKRVNGINPDPSGNINIGSQIVRAYDAFAKGATQIAWENIGGSWLVDQVALGSIVDRINELGQRDLPANTDLNTFKVPGNWTIHNQAQFQNLPDDEKWETLLVLGQKNF